MLLRLDGLDKKKFDGSRPSATFSIGLRRVPISCDVRFQPCIDIHKEQRQSRGGRGQLCLVGGLMASLAMAPVQDDDDDQYGEISFSPAAVGVQLKDQLSSGNDYAPRNIYNHFVSDETGGATVMQTEIGTPDDPFPTSIA
ncbi:uncharacterized protein LOC112195326 isoform X2 [Rosa chinensis]|uniref:uncharacterized protein LOC112195326 isoform X2 n=1 Tax=Rosa chinensis TaxID=74649 RepID=UPI000D08A7D0|nr:uncharacterized protein LOC112195326 isoform X2 [Rosa chinensis]